MAVDIEAATALRTSKPSFKRLLALLCTDIPVEGIVKAYRSPDWLERAAVARHPLTPINILKGLSEDGHMSVRIFALNNIAKHHNTKH